MRETSVWIILNESKFLTSWCIIGNNHIKRWNTGWVYLVNIHSHFIMKFGYPPDLKEDFNYILISEPGWQCLILERTYMYNKKHLWRPSFSTDRYNSNNLSTKISMVNLYEHFKIEPEAFKLMNLITYKEYMIRSMAAMFF